VRRNHNVHGAMRRLGRGTQGQKPARSHARRHKIEKDTRRGRGRPPGAKNYFTRDIKDAVMRAIERYGEDGEGKDGFEGFIFRCCSDEPKSVLNLVRAMMPQEMAVEHKEAPPENEAELRRYMQRLGINPALLEQIGRIEYHTPEEVLELTAEDVADDSTGHGGD
jgi:hypothetical protein